MSNLYLVTLVKNEKKDGDSLNPSTTVCHLYFGFAGLILVAVGLPIRQPGTSLAVEAVAAVATDGCNAVAPSATAAESEFLAGE